MSPETGRCCWTCVFWLEVTEKNTRHGWGRMRDGQVRGECIQQSPRAATAAGATWAEFPITGPNWLCGQHRSVGEEDREDFAQRAADRANRSPP
jgi:hypothetical protein